MFNNSNSSQMRRGLSSTRVLQTANQDENSAPIGKERIDQSGVMAGKSTIQTRRSVLGALNTNANNLNENNRTEVVRNLRTKTVRPSSNIPVKRTSEGVETTRKNENNENVGAANNAPVLAPVFPVKSVLKKTSEQPEPKHQVQVNEEVEFDKENVNPMNNNVIDWDDLDAEDAGDPLMVSDYVVEIFEYMTELEKKVTPPQHLMMKQPNLNWHMRSILVDWLIEVQWKLKLLPETLYLSINIIDRILGCRKVSLNRLQLVGLAATLLASKYEEVVAPSVQNFVFLADNSYNASELLIAERYIFQILNFSLAYPSPMSFLRRISKAESYDIRSRTLAKYLMEIALLDPTFVNQPPSLLAAVGIYFARMMLKSGPWTPNLIHYSGYQEFQVRRLMNRLLSFLQQEQRYLSIHRKYSSKKYMKASIFVYDWLNRHFPSSPCLRTKYYSNDASATTTEAPQSNN